MDQKTIDDGMRIAQEALLFALCNNNTTITAGECRLAIKTLFGEEVDSALAKKFVSENEEKNETKMS